MANILNRSINTPAYVFDEKVFVDRVLKTKMALGDSIPLTFSIKANPFLLHILPDNIAHVEVCSPGELAICKRMKIDPKRVIYSGVMKEPWDINEAIEYGVDIITAESPLQFENICDAADDSGNSVKVLLRLSSGNQFGMDEGTISEIIRNRGSHPDVSIIGIHFYSGTQKNKIKKIEKDISLLSGLINNLREKFGYTPDMVEYGPGLAAEYFIDNENRDGGNGVFANGGNELGNLDQDDINLLSDVTPLLKTFASKYPLAIEMGRFLASSCGTYYSEVKDIKKNVDITYAICDGGIHQLKYYGQMMAMQIPVIRVIRNGKEMTSEPSDAEEYCICGSLCTVADVLVREVKLPELQVGDVIAFEKCGAYSVTEGAGMFLSRDLPDVYIKHDNGVIETFREHVPTNQWNY